MAPDANYAPGELLVRFAPKADGTQCSTAEKNLILNSLGGGTIKRNSRHVPGLSLIKLPTGQIVKNNLQKYRNANGILHAGPNYKYKYGSTFPNDPCFPQLWELHNIGQGGGTPDADIDAPEAWDIHTGSSDIIVAVLDSGDVQAGCARRQKDGEKNVDSGSTGDMVKSANVTDFNI